MIYHLSLLENQWFLIERLLPSFGILSPKYLNILRHYLLMLFRVALPKFFTVIF